MKDHSSEGYYWDTSPLICKVHLYAKFGFAKNNLHISGVFASIELKLNIYNKICIIGKLMQQLLQCQAFSKFFKLPKDNLPKIHLFTCLNPNFAIIYIKVER